MISIYIIINFMAALYIFGSRRKVDIFTVLIYSTALFTFPLFTGYVSSSFEYGEKKISFVLYASFTLLQMSNLVFAILYDFFYKDKVFHGKAISNQFVMSLSVITFFTFLLFIRDVGFIKAFLGTKRDLVDSDSSFSLMFIWSCTILILILYVRANSLKDYIIPSLLVLVTILLGNRTPLAISILAFFIVKSVQRDKVSLLLSYPFRTIFFLISPVLLVSLMKPFYGQIRRTGDLSGFINLVQSEGLLMTMQRGMEFTRTQYIYNEMVLRDFTTDGLHILRGILSVLPVPRSLYTTPSKEFNLLFQPQLFPGHESGLANNLMAEFYVGFGVVGIVLCAVIIPFVSFVIQSNIRKANQLSQCLLALIGVLIAFYSFRNSVGVTFGFIRNVWMIVFFGYCYQVIYQSVVVKLRLLR